MYRIGRTASADPMMAVSQHQANTGLSMRQTEQIPVTLPRWGRKVLVLEIIPVPHVLPILDGMHMKMSFIYTIGIIMAGIGVMDVLAGTFVRVDEMLTCRKYPQNMGHAMCTFCCDM